MAFDKNLSKDDFIAKLGAKPGTYAYHLLDQVYDAFINNAEDLKAEYEKYHKKEYDSFEKFLENNKNFSKETIEKIKNAYKEGKTVLIGRFTSDTGIPIESYLCLEDFLIDENGIYIYGLEDGW
jgi:hypothetical protein